MRLNSMTSASFAIRLVASALLALGLAAAPAEAQEQGKYGNDLSLFVGNMLPNQIEGVSEILPVFGGRYAFTSSIGALEVGGANTHALGVDWTTLEVSLRGEIPVGDGLSGLIYFGPSFHYYTAAWETERKSETGIHAGAAGMMLVADTLWLRADLKFMGNPGTAMYLLFGLVFRGNGGN